jgi:hypothetical protein|tara:strand:- start:7574 stop:7762 length:189 start_codon:yes stop_codon:yes gene_type:complete
MDFLGKVSKVLSNKYVTASLLIVNVFVFSVGYYLVNTDLQILAGLSFATVLLSYEIRKNNDN